MVATYAKLYHQSFLKMFIMIDTNIDKRICSPNKALIGIRVKYALCLGYPVGT